MLRRTGAKKVPDAPHEHLPLSLSLSLSLELRADADSFTWRRGPATTRGPIGHPARQTLFLSNRVQHGSSRSGEAPTARGRVRDGLHRPVAHVPALPRGLCATWPPSSRCPAWGMTRSTLTNHSHREKRETGEGTRSTEENTFHKNPRSRVTRGKMRALLTLPPTAAAHVPQQHQARQVHVVVLILRLARCTWRETSRRT